MAMRYMVELFKADESTSVLGIADAGCPPEVRVMIGRQRTYVTMKPGESLAVRTLPDDEGAVRPTRRR